LIKIKVATLHATGGPGRWESRGTDVLILNLRAKLGRVVKAAPRPSGKKANKHCRRGSLSSYAGRDGYGKEHVSFPHCNLSHGLPRALQIPVSSILSRSL